MSVVRLAFADQHGVLRGKTLMAAEIDAALKNGVGFSAHAAAEGHRPIAPSSRSGSRAAASA